MKTDSKTLTTELEMRSEYDFSGAVRGEHYKPLHQGYSVHIHKSDGTTSIQNFKLEEGTVMLEPDVRAYFPDSKAVNHALRSLIQFMAQIPQQPKIMAEKTG